MSPRRRDPRSVEHETTLVASAVFATPDVVSAFEIAQPSHFSDAGLGALWGAARAMVERGEQPDPVAMWEEAGRPGGSVEAMIKLADRAIVAPNVKHHARQVALCALLRRVEGFCEGVSTLAQKSRPADALRVLEQVQGQLLAEFGPETTTSWMLTMPQVLKAAFMDLKERHAAGEAGDPLGIPTGFDALDKAIGDGLPLDDGNVVVFAGRPGMGKSALALNVFRHAIRNRSDLCHLYFSAEMGERQVGRRTLAAEANVGAQWLQRPSGPDNWSRPTKRSDEALNLLMQHIGRLKEQTKNAALVTKGSPTIGDVALYCRQWQHQTGLPLGVVVIDHIGLFQGQPGQTDTQRVTWLSNSFRRLSREFRCCFLVVSQLNREVEKRADHKPGLSDLKQSGAIEEDASVVAFVYRPHVYDEDADPEEMLVLIEKNREGSTWEVELKWKGAVQRVEEKRDGW